MTETWGSWPGMRVPPREPREPKIYEVDPAAVERLKAHIAREQEERRRRQQEKAAALMARARRAAAPQAAAAAAAEPTALLEDRARVAALMAGPTTDVLPALPAEEVSVSKRNKPGSLAALMTEERVERWAEMRRSGFSYDAITREDELHPSLPSIKTYLQKYGYDYQGRRMGEEPDPETVLAEMQEVHEEELRAEERAREAEEESRAVEAEESERAGRRAIVVANGNSAAPAQNGDDKPLPAREPAGQLAAVQRLMETLQAGDVQVSGRITVQLNVEIGIGA